MELIYQPLDFMGQNIYNGYYVRAGADGEPEFVDRAPGFPKTGSDWPVTPEAFYYGIKFLTERYPLPLYITENGMSCHDMVSSDGRVHDPNRITFLDSYIGAMQKAYDEGANVAGYFLWTFLDNFEWADGYKQRFGIVYVDFAKPEADCEGFRFLVSENNRDEWKDVDNESDNKRNLIFRSGVHAQYLGRYPA